MVANQDLIKAVESINSQVKNQCKKANDGEVDDRKMVTAELVRVFDLVRAEVVKKVLPHERSVKLQNCEAKQDAKQQVDQCVFLGEDARESPTREGFSPGRLGSSRLSRRGRQFHGPRVEACLDTTHGRR